MLRRELLDHVSVLKQRHLERLLAEHLDHYCHTVRAHQGLGGDTLSFSTMTDQGELISMSVVGGLHHRYFRAAR